MKYVRNLAKVDDNVMSVSPQINKENRPFVGVLVLVNNQKYCVPLSSPKDKYKNKKNAIDFMRIVDDNDKDVNGAGKIIGALNFNNMLPVDESVLKPINLSILSTDNSKAIHYKKLITKQLNWCQANENKILSHANRTYDAVTKYPDKSRNLTRRCCDFKKLEAVLEKYISKGERAAEKSSVRQSPYSRKKMNEMSQKVAQEKSNRDEHSKDISHKKNDQSL